MHRCQNYWSYHKSLGRDSDLHSSPTITTKFLDLSSIFRNDSSSKRFWGKSKICNTENHENRKGEHRQIIENCQTSTSHQKFVNFHKPMECNQTHDWEIIITCPNQRVFRSSFSQSEDLGILIISQKVFDLHIFSFSILIISQKNISLALSFSLHNFRQYLQTQNAKAKYLVA